MRERTQVLVVGAGPVGVLLSRLLHRFGVRCTVLERRSSLRDHPQAHYINNRSLEILRSFFWADHLAALEATPASHFWRDFVYCHTVKSDYHFLREDQFARTDKSFWLASPTSNLHLAQNIFEKILLRNYLQPAQGSSSRGSTDAALGLRGDPPILFGHELQSLTYDSNSTTAHVRAPDGQSISLTADFLVACDGANSRVRTLLGIPMDGQQQIQHLMNVHFCCPGLRDKLPNRTAMLYFVFNEAMVCVYVSHDVDKDEWICQIPYFPPFQSPSDFSDSHVLHLLRQTLFSDQHDPLAQRLQIRAVHHWVMHAEVARHFVHPSTGRIFLSGDAAHRFPPAGGFGMNTGIQDAHNLAWKLAHVLHGQSSRHWLASSYEQERKQIAEENTRFALSNYERSVSAARALGVDPKYAALAMDVAQSAVLRLVPQSVRTQAFLSALQVGLSTLQWLRRWPENIYGRSRVEALQRLSDLHRTLPLIFPEQDLGFSYVAGAQSWQPGRRLEHFWLLLQSPTRREACPTESGVDKSQGQTLDSSAVVVSSLDLPAIAQALRGKSRVGSSQQAAEDDLFVQGVARLPPAILLVRETTASQDEQRRLLHRLRESLSPTPRQESSSTTRTDARRVVVVHLREPTAPSDGKTRALLADSHTGECPSDLPSSLLHHETLQHYFQLPRYRPSSSCRSTLSVSATSSSENALHELSPLSTENARRLGDLLDDRPAVSSASRWQHLQDADGDLTAESLAGIPSQLPEVLLVRPDGHIGGSLSLRKEGRQTGRREEESEADVRDFCETIRSSLGLSGGR